MLPKSDNRVTQCFDDPFFSISIFYSYLPHTIALLTKKGENSVFMFRPSSPSPAFPILLLPPSSSSSPHLLTISDVTKLVDMEAMFAGTQALYCAFDDRILLPSSLKWCNETLALKHLHSLNYIFFIVNIKK